MDNEWMTIYSVIEEEDWEVTIWNFYDETEARKFTYARFERQAWDYNFDSPQEVIDAWYEADWEKCYFRMDWYYLYIKKTTILNHNIYSDEGTKEFRGDTKRSRQEDRTTPSVGWEV